MTWETSHGWPNSIHFVRKWGNFMSKEYNKLAGDILKAVGGKENVATLRHCVTRLRFVLKDEKLAKDDEIKKMKGVATVVKSAGEYMVVIGEHVHSVFEEVCAHMGVDGKDRSEVTIAQKKKNPLEQVLALIMGAMGPTLNLMCACGIIKGLLVLLLIAGLPSDSGIYQLLNAAGDCFFYFMPLLMGYNLARKLEFDPVFGFILAAAMCYPNVQGVDLNFFGYTVNATYTGTFLPVIFGVAVAAPIYKFFDKRIPKIVKGFVVPLLALVVAYPLTFLVVGPIANLVGTGINVALTAIVSISPALAGLLMGGFWQVMVLFGVHGIPMMFAFFDVLAGNPSQILSLVSGVCWAVCGTVLAVYLRTKDNELKGVALPALISAIFGVTEPSVYGVLLPNIKTFVYTCIGGAASGLIAGLFHVLTYSYTGMGFLGILGLMNPDGPTNFLAIALMIVVPFVIAFALSFVLFRDKVPEVADAPAPAPAKPAREPLNKRVILSAPVTGEAKPLSACTDAAFSEETLGKGCVIVPTEGKLVAPCDGKVCRLFSTKHAVGLETADGVEILIHIGMDTVSLKGQHFETHVSEGDTVKKGQLLITFDKAAIEKAGFITETPMVITNTDDYLDVVQMVEGPVQSGTDVLAVLM